MMSNKANMRLLRTLSMAVEGAGVSVDQVWHGFAKMAWPQNLRQVTIGQLHQRSPWGPEHEHPKRLLAELDDEFDLAR